MRAGAPNRSTPAHRPARHKPPQTPPPPRPRATPGKTATRVPPPAPPGPPAGTAASAPRPLATAPPGGSAASPFSPAISAWQQPFRIHAGQPIHQLRILLLLLAFLLPSIARRPPAHNDVIPSR